MKVSNTAATVALLRYHIPFRETSRRLVAWFLAVVAQTVLRGTFPGNVADWGQTSSTGRKRSRSEHTDTTLEAMLSERHFQSGAVS